MGNSTHGIILSADRLLQQCTSSEQQFQVFESCALAARTIIMRILADGRFTVETGIKGLVHNLILEVN